MKVSVLHYGHESIDTVLEVAEAVDSLGFDAWYVTDSSYRKDVWVVLGAAARLTAKARIGPSAIRLLLTDPLVAARALATLDELSGGRVDAVLGLGGKMFLNAGTSSRPHRQLAYLREAFAVIRQAL